MSGNKKRGKRVFTAMRMDPVLRQRVEAIAKKQRTSERAVIEQLLDAGIAEMERRYGIVPDAGQDTKHN